MATDSSYTPDFSVNVAAKLAKRLSTSRRDVSVTRLGAAYETASVLSSFELENIQSTSNPPLEVENLILDSVQTTIGARGPRWMLSPEKRVTALRQLRESGRIGSILDAAPTGNDELLQLTLAAYLTGTPKPIGDQSLEELGCSYQVCEWLRAAGFENIPTADNIQQQIDWRRLLEPFEHIAGQHFRGRKDELARLRSYVGILPPGSFLDSVQKRIETVLGITSKPPLVVYGPGGVGKSTLEVIS